MQAAQTQIALNSGEDDFLYSFGYGYTAEYLTKALYKHDFQGQIGGTTRDPDKKKKLIAQGIKANIFDGDELGAGSLQTASKMTHILISVPPDGDGCPVARASQNERVDLSSLKALAYLSTTGVYGNRDGGAVTEESELRPSSKRGTRRAKAEQQWMKIAERLNKPLYIYRLAGIYGPGRSAIDSVRAGIARRIYKEGHVFNRIHVEDIATIILKTLFMERDGNGTDIYNLADDKPSSSHEVIEYASDLLDIHAPPLISYEEANLSPMTASFYNDHKIVRNDKIKTMIGGELLYPTYREGLKACL